MTPMMSVCPGCDHEQACGHAEVHACAMREPAGIARLSAAAGMTAEEAIANAAVRMVEFGRTGSGDAPASWCSCDPLRRAEAERDRYRDVAMSAACRARIASGLCGGVRGGHFYCDAVLGEVDGA